MKVCIVVQNLNYLRPQPNPLGLFYIAASLQQAGHEIYWMEFPSKTNIKDICDEATRHIKENEVKVFMCGSLFPGWKEFRDVCDGVKSANKDVYMIGGGGLITYSPKIAMELCSNCDIGVIGEGELTIVKLIESLETNKIPLKNVPGIIFRNFDNELVKTAPGEIPIELDNLPYPCFPPVYELMIARSKSISICGGRSCPYGCTFCALSTQKKYRQRGIDSLVEEATYYVNKYGVNFIQFIDELFTEDITRLRLFMEKIKKLKIRYLIQTRPNSNIDSTLLRDLANSGMYIYSFGTENFNETILKSMNKGTDVALLEKCLNNVEEAGLSANFTVCILFGDPVETPQTVANSISWIRKNGHRYKAIAMSGIHLYPGSKLYADAVKKFLIDEKEFFEATEIFPPAVNLTNFTEGQFTAMRHIVAQGRVLCSKNHLAQVDFIKNHNDVIIKCTCCGNTGEFSVNEWNTSPDDYIRYKLMQVCPHCFLLPYFVIGSFYAEVGRNLKIYLNKNRCAIWGADYILNILADDIKDCDFRLVDKNIPYYAKDWEIFEELLNKSKPMTSLLQKHPYFTKLPNDMEIDTVIVLEKSQFVNIKTEVHSINPKIKVILYADILKFS